MAVALCCSRYYYSTTSFHTAKTQVLRRFKPCLRRVWDSRWWECLTMFSVGNKAKRFWSANHTTKTIHYHHLHHYHQRLCFNTVPFSLLMLSLFDYEGFLSCFSSESAVMQEKKQIVYGFCSNKVSSKRFWSIFASNISLIIVCNVWIKCR